MTTFHKPILHPIQSAKFQIEGEVGRRLHDVTKQWILPAPFVNPGLLEMFRNRDRLPYQSQSPWAGEFAGKYITHSVQIYRLTHDKKLRDHLAWFIGEFIALQDEDGYLGSWPKAWRLKRGAPNCGEPWDAWGHYHAMLGLLFWYQQTGDKKVLNCVRRIGDLFCNRFLGEKSEKLHDTGMLESNQAPVHSLTLLYEITSEKKYLQMAQQIVKEFEIPPAGDYVRTALAGKEFWETPKPRWESLHPIMGIAELYYVTGLEQYRQAFEHLWWSMLKGDRHNNGGFTSGEKATGNPYDQGAIETCCTVAWMAMSVEMLRLTGKSIVADELEISMLNSGLGMMSPSGRWVTYNTPMDGQKEASAHTIVFQARAGTSELNCCSVNGPRAIGMLCEWAVMSRADGLAITYYGPCSIQTTLAKLTQTTDYPHNGKITIAVQPKKAATFTLALRIPQWSAKTKVRINGQIQKNPTPTPGTYFEINRKWKSGDKIQIELDMGLHFWAYKPMYRFEFVDLDLKWKLFGPTPRVSDDADSCWFPVSTITDALNGLTEIPATLIINGVTYQSRDVQSVDGVIDCRKLFPQVGGQPVAYAMAEFEIDEAQKLDLGFTADWWSIWYLNGQVVYDNQKSGNGDFHNRHHIMTLSLKKGRNILAFRLAGGASRGCWISIGRNKTLREIANSPQQNQAYATSIYRGPILLAYDPRYNVTDAPLPDTLDAAQCHRAASKHPSDDESADHLRL